MRTKWIGLLAVFFLSLVSPVAAQTVLYVPSDDRPVSLAYVVDTASAVGVTILTPPEALLASRTRDGDATGLWEWVDERCGEVDSLILSADSLLYGGLVSSRTHELNPELLQQRLAQFSRLQTLNPSMRLYVFSTVMRTPKFSAGGVEPPYYEQYGYRIFQRSALQDKQELQALTPAEKERLATLRAEVPVADWTDWQARRDKNLRMNAGLIDLAQQGLLNYLLIGRDDTAPYSQSHRETRGLLKLTAGIQGSRFATFPGADQLGMILLTRAVNEFNGRMPVVVVRYTPGVGPGTVPTYEDQATGQTTFDHILAAGGVPLLTPALADVILAVNTPADGITHEADSSANTVQVSPAVRQFADDVQHWLQAGKKVAVADIAFGNGADNALMAEMSARGLLPQLAAYSGWNTASNTTGYAIGQGMLADSMSDRDRRQLLTVRYLDDWAYQANIRNELNQSINYPRGGSLVLLDDRRPELMTAAESKLRSFADRYLAGLPTANLHAEFPWNRMFEIYVTVDGQ
jgi:hypothetical protein